MIMPGSISSDAAGGDESLAHTAREERTPDAQETANSECVAPRAPPPFQSTLWSKDPVIAQKRVLYFKVLIGGVFIVSFIVFAVLSIFWGSSYDLSSHIHQLNGWVVDFDGGPIGRTVVQAFMNNSGARQQMSWHIVDASQFPNFPSDVMDAVIGERIWVAICVNPGASANLTEAVSNADGSYNGSRAVTAYFVEGRNERAYSSFLLPQTMESLTLAAQTFAIQNTRQLGTNSSVNASSLLAQAPNVVSMPVYFTINNLRPFDVTVAQAVVFVGLIFLIIIANTATMTNFSGRVLVSGLERQLTLRSLVLVRITVPVILYFIMSLFFSLLSLAFQVPFDRFHGASGFVIYWMMNWAGMCALGFMLEAMLTLLTPQFLPIFFIFWIIINASVSAMPIEVLYRFYKYGYAMPFYNVSRTARAIVFGSRDQIGLNFGVQFAWIVSGITILTLSTILTQKREERVWTMQQKIEGYEKRDTEKTEI